jgi:dGTPase
MEWEKLLTRKRVGDTSAFLNETGPLRSDFEKDFDRVVFSSAFRRLQDKTQVIPLPKNDFVHSRLTHSLEVSCVGRSLGKMCGQELIDKHPGLYTKSGFSSSDFGAIVAAACLAHDIGNPPFGHSGEKAIGEYFEFGAGNRFKKEIADEKKWNDLIRFEGNASGFKILTNTNTGMSGGSRLTYATLGAFTKYPKESFPVFNDKKVHEKKFGFFQSEKEIFKDIALELGLHDHRNNGHLNWCRHPLAFLVEAADDICYSVIDLEDGLRLRLIPAQYAEDLLIPLIGDEFQKERYIQISDFGEKLGYLRAKTINRLIRDSFSVFVENEENILNGTFSESILKKGRYYERVELIKKITLENVYRSKKVLEIEAAGFEVLGGLLELFICAVDDKLNGRRRFRSENIYDLIPSRFLGNERKPDEESYIRIMKICEFVAGMTDSYAISIYRKLRGIELPNE